MEFTFLSMNYPDRENFYQMMIACQVARSNSKTPQAIQPGNFRLTFGSDKPITREERDKRALEVRDARIAARGGLGKYTLMDAQGNVIAPPKEPIHGSGQSRSQVHGNPLLRQPSPEEIKQFQERQRSMRAGDPRVRNPRSSSDGKG